MSVLLIKDFNSESKNKIFIIKVFTRHFLKIKKFTIDILVKLANINFYLYFFFFILSERHLKKLMKGQVILD